MTFEPAPPVPARQACLVPGVWLLAGVVALGATFGCSRGLVSGSKSLDPLGVSKVLPGGDSDDRDIAEAARNDPFPTAQAALGKKSDAH